MCAFAVISRGLRWLFVYFGFLLVSTAVDRQSPFLRIISIVHFHPCSFSLQFLSPIQWTINFALFSSCSFRMGNSTFVRVWVVIGYNYFETYKTFSSVNFTCFLFSFNCWLLPAVELDLNYFQLGIDEADAFDWLIANSFEFTYQWSGAPVIGCSFPN